MIPVARRRDLADVLANDRVAIDAALQRARRLLVSEACGPVAASLDYALDAQGKRLRPILCVAGYRAVLRGPDKGAIHDVAAAIEMLHTYSLVHDDLPCMDDDDVRRGRPTAHRVHGVVAATLAGAALIAGACRALARAGGRLGLEPRERAALVSELTRAAGGGGMVGGQLLDLEAEGRTAGPEDLESIHRRKTGALFEASLRIGGIAAGADPAVVAALGECGRELGLAFQIADDLLDEMGRADLLQKTAGRDRARAKATFPSVLGVAAARERAAAAQSRALMALDRAEIDDPTLRAIVRFAADRAR